MIPAALNVFFWPLSVGDKKDLYKNFKIKVSLQIILNTKVAGVWISGESNVYHRPLFF